MLTLGSDTREFGRNTGLPDKMMANELILYQPGHSRVWQRSIGWTHMAAAMTKPLDLGKAKAKAKALLLEAEIGQTRNLPLR